MYKNKHKKENFFITKILSSYVVFGGVFFIAMAATLFAVNMGAPAERSEAETRSRIRFGIEDVLSITSGQDELTLELTPSAGGAFAYGTMPITVATNSLSGYSLMISTDNSSNALGAPGAAGEIVALSGEATVTDDDKTGFTKNAWGYTVENNLGKGGSASATVFKPVPVLSEPELIKRTSEFESSNVTNVAFAVKADTDLPSGVYNNTILFTATVNVVPDTEDVRTLFDIYYMQDMTEGICNRTTTPTAAATELDTTGEKAGDENFVPSVELVDKRDGEQYTVRKLADGNCWMTQNLRLKLTANTPLTSADTDVSSNFTPTLSTQPTSENTTSWGAYDNASDVNKSRSYDTGNRDYGTYYNWFTATAGTGTYDMTSGNATGSICPKNWQLPQNTGTKSYYNLITTTYGLASNAEGSTALQSAPLSFPLSGYYYYSGSVNSQGSRGYFWSATPGSSARSAYDLYFYSSSIYPQSSSYEAFGFSVRCVARDDPKPDNTSELT